MFKGIYLPYRSWFVIPAKAGIQGKLPRLQLNDELDSRLRGNDSREKISFYPISRREA